jgi:hypothetical protein
MSKPIPLREYVAGGLVDEATVNALLARGGEPMLTDCRDLGWASPFRAWMRWPVGLGMRTMGPPAWTAQAAAEGLLRKIEGRR